MIVAYALVQLRDFRHLLIGKGKVEDIQIVPDMINILASGDNGKAHLGMPAENDLCWSLSIFFPEFCEHRLVLQGLIAVAQWIPAHQLNAVLVQCLTKLLLSKVRMCLHLNELRHNLPFGLQLFDVLAFKVGDADGFRFAFLIRLFELPITCQPVACGLVDVKQIHIVHAQTLQGLVHCVLVLIFTGPELGREEDILPLYAAVLHAAPHCTLVDIGVGGIHKGIAHLQGFPDAVLSFRRRKHKGSDPDHRAPHSIVQYDIFHDDLLSFPIFFYCWG